MQLKLFNKARHYLFVRIYLYFAILLIVFAIVLGVIYVNIFRSTSESEYKEQVRTQAQNISSELTVFIKNNDFDGGFEYLSFCATIDSSNEVWAIPNNTVDEPLDERFVTIDLRGEAVQEEFKALIRHATGGAMAVDIFYSDMHGVTICSAAVPIKNGAGEVIGILIRNISLESMNKFTLRGYYAILISSVAAVTIAVLLAAFFARNLTRPITRMRDHANELAEGHYTSVTGIERLDEVGELASAIDFLTEKLNENERVRSELDRMRMDFFSNVSHELRTPITVVRAYTETLVDNVVTDPDEINNYYDRILAETKSMERLVGDLLLLSKLQNPDFKIEKEPINLCQIFTEIQRSLGPILDKAGVELSVVSNSESVMVMGDYDRIRQMFLIVIDNAIKFSKSGDDIAVSIESVEHVVVVIADRGVGMSEDEMNSVFEKFYSSKLSRDSGGSGLGLSIAKHIADRHDCELTVSSVKGSGSTFTFVFAVATDEDVMAEE